MVAGISLDWRKLAWSCAWEITQEDILEEEGFVAIATTINEIWRSLSSRDAMGDGHDRSKIVLMTYQGESPEAIG